MARARDGAHLLRASVLAAALLRLPSWLALTLGQLSEMAALRFKPVAPRCLLRKKCCASSSGTTVRLLRARLSSVQHTPSLVRDVVKMSSA